jgi:hypothetical protein
MRFREGKSPCLTRAPPAGKDGIGGGCVIQQLRRACPTVSVLDTGIETIFTLVNFTKPNIKRYQPAIPKDY